MIDRGGGTAKEFRTVGNTSLNAARRTRELDWLAYVFAAVLTGTVAG